MVYSTKCAGFLHHVNAQEFDINLDEMPLAERLAFQRAQLKQNLGMVGQFGGDDDDLISDEDLVMHTKLEQAKKEEEVKREAEVENTEGMSARQRNAAKRRAKKMAKDTTTKRGRGASASASAPAPKADESAPKKGRNMKTVVTDQPQSSDKVVLESVVDNEKAYEDTTVWPFQDITEDLCHDLFKYVFASASFAAFPELPDSRRPATAPIGR